MDFERYLSYIAHPVVILDKLNQVLAMNPAFESLFPRVEPAENLYAFTDCYPVLLPLLHEGEGQYALAHGGRHYSVHISFTRYGKRNRPVARCILLTDETETIELLREVRRQSRELQRSNEQVSAQNARLQESIRAKQEASALRTQAQLLRDIHDTLGHTLVMVGALHNLALDA
jgi:signal transduction histidine kinase